MGIVHIYMHFDLENPSLLGTPTGPGLTPTTVFLQLFFKAGLGFILEITITRVQPLEHAPILFILE